MTQITIGTSNFIFLRESKCQFYKKDELSQLNLVMKIVHFSLTMLELIRNGVHINANLIHTKANLLHYVILQ